VSAWAQGTVGGAANDGDLITIAGLPCFSEPIEHQSTAETPIADPGADDPASSDRFPSDISLANGQAWKKLLLNIRHDQRHVIEFPVHLVTQGRHWKPTLAVAALTAGLVALDPHDTPYFGKTTAFHGFNNVLSGTNTALAMVAVPVAFYGWSAHEHDTYGKQTVFLAVEAMADVQILAFGMQMIDRRIRPVDVPPHGNYADTWFEAGFFDRKSFPSAHTITAFALADVFTERYPQHRWVPWVSYGLASTIGFSRLTSQAHFPSDIVVGAVLGFVVTHYLVLHHHDR